MMKNTARNDSWKLMLSSDDGLTSSMPKALSASACMGASDRCASVAVITAVHITAALTSESGSPASST